MLQIMRTGLKNRQKDKSDAPAEMSGELAKSVHKLKNIHEARFFPSSGLVFSAPPSRKPEEKESLLSVSGASVHMLSRKDLNSAEMETVRVSRNLQRSQQPVDKCKRTRKGTENHQRFGSIRDGAVSGRHSSSLFAWTTLQRS